MLKKVLLLSLASLFIISASAQNFKFEEVNETTDATRFLETQDDVASIDLEHRVSIGPKVGMNCVMGNFGGFDTNSGLNGTHLSTGVGFGYHAGAVINAHFGRRTISSEGGTGWFGVQAEVLYSHKSFSLNDTKLAFNSFEIPVLAQCYFSPNFYVELGPTFTGSFASKPDYLNVGGNTVFSVNEIKAYDVMVSIGLGFKSNKGLMVNARYNLSTSDVAGNLPVKMNTLTVSLGWVFNVVK